MVINFDRVRPRDVGRSWNFMSLPMRPASDCTAGFEPAFTKSIVSDRAFGLGPAASADIVAFLVA